MGYLGKVKEKISVSSELREEAKKEKQHQKTIKKMEKRKAEIAKLSLEAEECGISFSEYMQYLIYKEIKDDIETKNLTQLSDAMHRVNDDIDKLSEQ